MKKPIKIIRMPIVKLHPYSEKETIGQSISQREDAVSEKLIWKYSYLRGFSRNLWPIVTNLVSWYDMKPARDETLKYIT
jgi:hypothetical protein